MIPSEIRIKEEKGRKTEVKTRIKEEARVSEAAPEMENEVRDMTERMADGMDGEDDAGMRRDVPEAHRGVGFGAGC